MSDAATQTDNRGTVDTENNDPDHLDWESFHQHVRIVFFVTCFSLISVLFVSGFCIAAQLHILIWQVKLIGIRQYNMVHQRQFFQMQIMIYICLCSMMLIVLIHGICFLTPRIFIKRIIEMNWHTWAFLYICGFIICSRFTDVVRSETSIQKCVQIIQQELISQITFKSNFLSASAEEQYLILTYPKTLVCFQYMSFTFSAGHLIIIILLIIHRPADYHRYLEDIFG